MSDLPLMLHVLQRFIKVLYQDAGSIVGAQGVQAETGSKETDAS